VCTAVQDNSGQWQHPSIDGGAESMQL